VLNLSAWLRTKIRNLNSLKQDLKQQEATGHSFDHGLGSLNLDLNQQKAALTLT
jgi:hypothetical protein